MTFDARAGDWPDCDDAQVPVMLLGTYHMDNPGLDEVNVDADDVLADDRQAELRRLVDALAEWNPDRVAVERPYDGAAALNDRYREYRRGERAYDREETVASPHPARNDATMESRSEVVQVGFRLADRLDHERVYPVDDPMDIATADAAALEERGFEPETKVDVSRVDPGEHQREVNERLVESTIPEYLRWLNAPGQLSVNHELMFGDYVRYGEGDNFGGPGVLAGWYERNLRMVHLLWRAVESGDDRVVFVVGSGHVRALRHLLAETPQFCPVSPLSVLDSAVEG